MICSNCGKNNTSITYKQNINGKKITLNLCDNCAHEIGIFNSFDDIFSPMILDFEYVLPEEIKCKKCGYTLSKYRSTGLFGCDECYNTFKKEIDEILLKIQGKNRQIKEEKNIKKESINQVDKLKQELQELVKQEKFEEAAVIRDKIKDLEKKSKKEEE